MLTGEEEVGESNAEAYLDLSKGMENGLTVP